jgi:hypothetical protein
LLDGLRSQDIGRLLLWQTGLVKCRLRMVVYILRKEGLCSSGRLIIYSSLLEIYCINLLKSLNSGSWVYDLYELRLILQSRGASRCAIDQEYLGLYWLELLRCRLSRKHHVREITLLIELRHRLIKKNGSAFLSNMRRERNELGARQRGVLCSDILLST